MFAQLSGSGAGTIASTPMLPPRNCRSNTLRHPTAARPHSSLTAMVGCVSFIWKHAFSDRPARSLCFSCKVAGSKGLRRQGVGGEEARILP